MCEYLSTACYDRLCPYTHPDEVKYCTGSVFVYQGQQHDSIIFTAEFDSNSPYIFIGTPGGGFDNEDITVSHTFEREVTEELAIPAHRLRFNGSKQNAPKLIGHLDNESICPHIRGNHEPTSIIKDTYRPDRPTFIFVYEITTHQKPHATSQNPIVLFIPKDYIHTIGTKAGEQLSDLSGLGVSVEVHHTIDQTQLEHKSILFIGTAAQIIAGQITF